MWKIKHIIFGAKTNNLEQIQTKNLKKIQNYNLNVESPPITTMLELLVMVLGQLFSINFCPIKSHSSVTKYRLLDFRRLIASKTFIFTTHKPQVKVNINIELYRCQD